MNKKEKTFRADIKDLFFAKLARNIWPYNKQAELIDILCDLVREAENAGAIGNNEREEKPFKNFFNIVGSYGLKKASSDDDLRGIVEASVKTKTFKTEYEVYTLLYNALEPKKSKIDFFS